MFATPYTMPGGTLFHEFFSSRVKYLGFTQAALVRENGEKLDTAEFPPEGESPKPFAVPEPADFEDARKGEASCLVADEYDIGGNLQRILKAAGQQAPASKPILEINPTHPAVQRLKYEETRFADWANLLLEQATLAEGGTLEDPAGFVRRINDLMLALSLGSGR